MRPPAPPPGFIARHRFVLLFVTLLSFFVSMPIVHQLRAVLDPAAPTILESIAFIIVLGGTVASVSRSKAWKRLTVALGLPTALLVVAHCFSDEDWITISHHLFAAAFLGYAIVVMLGCIFATRRVTFNTVCAALCIYLLLGIGWALGYSVIYHLDTTAFHSSVATAEDPLHLDIGRGRSAGVLYYSFVTLTTLGYGDIVPTSPLARMLATLEAITGQLYLAVLVARLVGLNIGEGIGSGREPPGPADS